MRVETSLTAKEQTALMQAAVRRGMSLSEYLRFVALSDVQRVDDLTDRVAHRVAGDVGPTMQAALRQVVEEHADRLVNAFAEGLGIAVAAVAGRPVDEGLVDRLADEMHAAYEYEDDGEAGGAGEHNESTS